MEWVFRRKQGFFGKSEEGEYSFQITKNGVSLGLEYQDGNKSYLEIAAIESGEVIVETLIVDNEGRKIKKGVSKLLANKDKVNTIPSRKARALAQLVIAEAEKSE